MRLFRPVSAIACAVVVTSACTDTTAAAPAPHRRSPLAPSVSPAAASHPTGERYRDSGCHPATGRAGSAIVAMRALIDKSGTTDVAVTTGTFDAGPAPGTLAKVQGTA